MTHVVVNVKVDKKLYDSAIQNWIVNNNGVAPTDEQVKELFVIEAEHAIRSMEDDIDEIVINHLEAWDKIGS